MDERQQVIERLRERRRQQVLDNLRAMRDGAPQQAGVIEEMHPGVSVADRALVKNLANSDEAALGYLKKEYPDLDIQLHQGRILIRKPGEPDYRVLDPNNMGFRGYLGNPAELFRDAGDVLYDVGAGALEGVATVGGAAAGTVGATPGVGTMAGAMLGSGLASAGTETVRQGMGKLAGIDQDVDPVDVLVAGGAGLASPLVFGTGKVMKKSVQDAVAEAAEKGVKDMPKDEVKGLLQKVADYGRNRVFPWLTEKSSGVDRNAVRGLINRYDEVRGLEKEGVTNLLESGRKDWVDAFDKNRREAGELIGQHLKSIDKKVNIQPAKRAFTKELLRLRGIARRSNRPADVQKYADAVHIWAKYFSTNPEQRTYQRFVKNNPIYEPSRIRTGGPSLNTTGLVPEGVNPDDFVGDNTIIDMARNPHAPDFKVQNVSYQSTILPSKVDADIAMSLREDLDFLSRKKYITEGVEDRFTKGTKVSDKRLRNSLLDAERSVTNSLEKAIDESATQLTGAGYAKARKTYKDLLALRRSVGGSLDDTQKYEKFIRRLNAPSNRTMREKLEHVDHQFETDLTSQAELMNVFDVYGKAALDPISSGRTGSASRTIPLAALGTGLGWVTGYNIGGDYTGGILGSIVGTQAGALLGAPATTKMTVGLGKGVHRGLVSPLLPRGPKAGISVEAAKSIWREMKDRQEAERRHNQQFAPAYGP